MNNRFDDIHVINLKDWFKESHSDDDKRNLFLYMDFAMRYVHDRGYCVSTFNPTEIEILNNSIKQIKFNTLYKMPEDDPEYQEYLKNEDIFNSSAVQILLYSNFPMNTKTDFLKQNFEEFISFLPETDIPYYRGVIERGASVYFTEYELERVKRENENLENELKELNTPKDNIINDYKKKKDLSKMFTNDKINNAIYRKINSIQESAFINVLLYPTVVIVLILVYSFIKFLIRNLGF